MSEIELLKGHCVKCGYTWILRKLKPIRCPHCNCADIDKPSVRKVKGYQEPLRFTKGKNQQKKAMS